MKRYIIILLIAIILAGCTIKGTKGTQWEIDLNLPLLDEKYPVSDLIDNENIFLNESDSTLYVETKGDINTKRIEELAVELDSEFSVNHLYSTLNSFPGSIPFVSILPDYTIEVVAGKIESGYLILNLNDIVQETHDATAKIVFNEIYTQEGEHFSPAIDISQFGSFEYRFNLADYVIKSTDNIMEGNSINSLSFTISVTDNQGNPGMVDYGSLNIKLSDMIYFESFLGNIDGYYIEIEEDLANVEIEYPQNIDDVVIIEDALVELNLTSNIGFSTIFEGSITSYNDKGDSIRIDILDDHGERFTIPSADIELISNYPVTQPVDYQFISDEQIDYLFSIMPTSLVIKSSRVHVENPADGYGFISTNHSIFGDYTGNIPFNFSLQDSSVPLITDKDTIANISQDNQKIIDEYCQSAELELRIDNKLPIGARLSIFIHSVPLGNTVDSLYEATLYFNGDDIDDDGIGDGFYVEAGNNSETYKISVNNFEVFINDEIYIKFLMYADPTQEPVVITGTVDDYIKISGSLKLKVLMQS